MTSMLSNRKINHVVFIVDRSGSMSGLEERVIEAFDRQVLDLGRLSTEMDQETRASVYMFSNDCACVAYDQDVLRMPSLRGHYRVTGNTALLDAVAQAIHELEQTATLHGDHAFLVYALTDGQENASHRITPSKLTTMIRDRTDNWTVAALVPDASGEQAARRFGFLPGNILQWSATAEGMMAAGQRMSSATVAFMHGRASGQRATGTLFTPDVSAIDQRTVNRTVPRLDPADYALYEVRSPMAIRPFVERETGQAYVIGNTYYCLTKPETVQAQKRLILCHHRTGVAYAGDGVRSLLGLPDYEIRVNPASHPDYAIFVQSTSVNRKLVPGTRLLVMTARRKVTA